MRQDVVIQIGRVHVETESVVVHSVDGRAARRQRRGRTARRYADRRRTARLRPATTTITTAKHLATHQPTINSFTVNQ